MSKQGKNLESMEFWTVIEKMDFNGRGHEAAGRWLVEDSGLTFSEIKNVEKTANLIASYVMRLLEGNVTGVGDDAFSDVCWQIIANGREAYKNATAESTQEMIDNDDYTESFAYAFHAVHDIVDEQQHANLFLKKERAMKRIEQMRQMGGGFDQKLVAAFEHADNSNKRKLAIGFPELFEHLVD